MAAAIQAAGTDGGTVDRPVATEITEIGDTCEFHMWTRARVIVVTSARCSSMYSRYYVVIATLCDESTGFRPYTDDRRYQLFCL